VNLQFSGNEVISRSKTDVWNFVNDSNSVAPCLPDVIDYQIKDEHHFDATVGVAVGPVRGKFKFKIEIDPQSDGEHVNLNISGGALGSVVDVAADADITGDTTSTALDWNATASVRGPVATVGGRVLQTQAQRIIGATFSNIKTQLSNRTTAS